MSKISHISYSSVEKELQCARCWYYKYVLKQELPAGEAASFGKQFDVMVAHRLGLGPAPAEPLVAGVADAVFAYLAHEEAWMHASAAQTEVKCSPSQWQVLAEECGANPVLPWPIIGFLDLERTMEDGIRREVLDLKTTSRREFRWSWALQGTLYALFRRAYRWHVHAVVRTKNLQIATWTYYPSIKTFRWAMDLVAASAARMKAWERMGVEEVQAVPGYHCEFCAGRNECEASVCGRL